MSYLKIRLLPLGMLLSLALTACAPLAVATMGVGVSYTLTNVAYKTFNSPLYDVHMATEKALKKLDMKSIEYTESDEGTQINAKTPELDIVITLEKITLKATRQKVDVRKQKILKDKATAAEIISQTELFLKDVG
ncbi:MAG: DUF3568 family protein [Deltaproteobacteria bacterium]|nr:DUF3568 family protein [Deltaproteobacteria bacterium]